MNSDNDWMRHAIALARQGALQPGANPIGCVIVSDGRLIAESHNEVEARHDATAHAEIMAIRRAGQRLGTHELRGATLFSTLEPCGMCTLAAIWAKLGRVVFGAGRHDVHPMYFEERHIKAVDLVRDAWRDDIVIDGGVLAAECATLYLPPDAAVPERDQVNR